MEVEKEIQREYNPAHPNYERWQKGRELSDERAKFVEFILSNEIHLRGLKILDLGAGEGSTSRLLSKDNFVISLEIKTERAKKISRSVSLVPVIADGFNIPIKTASLNIIILQDVIEHLTIKSEFIDELISLLKDDGIIYLSTPNKISVINIIADPHWGMPLLSLFRRDKIKKYFLKNFRRADYQRDDVAELLSLKDVYNLFGRKLSIKIQTKRSINYLLNGGSGLVWSNFHIQILNLINKFGLKKVLIGAANDRHGFINNFFTPTFNLILKKK